MIPLSDYPLTKRVTLTGFRVLSMATGNYTMEYEWSTKSFDNNMMAINRQISPQIMPDLDHVRRLGEMTDEWFDWMKKGMYLTDSMKYATLMDYPKSHSDWPHHKQLRYEENILSAFYDPSFKDLVGPFVAMVKSGEVYRTENFRFDSNGCLLGRSDRPRLICAPNVKGQGLLQAI